MKEELINPSEDPPPHEPWPWHTEYGVRRPEYDSGVLDSFLNSPNSTALSSCLVLAGSL